MLIAAAALPLIGAVYVVGRLLGPGVAAIAIGIVVALATAGALLTWMQSDATKAFRKKLASLNFQPDALEWCGAGTLIAIDKSSRRLAIQASGALMLRDFDTLVGVEIEEDGATIQKTDRGSQLGGALVGGLIAGPAGLIVGGLSGTRRTENRVRAVTLNIFTRDTTNPTLKLSFLNDPSGAMATSETYKAARLQAQEWYSRIRAVIET
ncbi:hypothetical protein LK533_14140 [Sphingomonas sp. PL-96]|uniref:hypothetical protein n=1 Tax=Sphingomonas sp. PL-96 TaxID=2887201 RepID=UPI001E333788|nr:hypothetical protein [Sphingomonas sp. PL-96]MCC2977812.1 hypothetical protein [Sphingomonas sp. PL-96]